MNQKREPKGAKSGGQFAPSSNPESTVVLTDVNMLIAEEYKTGWVIDADEYIFTLSRPNQDERRDFWEARFDDQEHEEMEADSESFSGDTFEDVIGQFDRWPAVKQAMTEKHKEWMAEKPSATPRDLLNGGYTPAALAEFEQIWAGQKDGLSETAAKKNLSKYQKQRDDLDAGIITPRKIIGTGYDKGLDTRKLAEDVIDEQIAQTKLAINSRGQSSSLNRRSVAHSLSNEGASSIPTRHGFPKISPF